MEVRATIRLRNNKMLEKRKGLGLSQPELAEHCGVPKRAVMELEKFNYRCYPGLLIEYAVMIAKTLEVDLDDILPENALGEALPEKMQSVATIENEKFIEGLRSDRFLIDSPESIAIKKEIKEGTLAEIRRVVKGREELRGKYSGYRGGAITDRDLDILKHRFGLDGAPFMTLQDLGKKYGFTRERIWQIECRLVRELQKSKYLQALWESMTGKKLEE
jgi:DNA-binding XRE family transcriptional regulator